MSICPFCNQNLINNLCPFCGYSNVLALPYYRSTSSYRIFSLIGIFSALSSFVFSFFISLNILGLIFSLGAIGLCGTALEKSQNRAKLLAVIGLILGAVGFIWSILINSHLPSSGYTM